eukprot:TRINITY_DN37841_c0_g1_i1.p1 TRINITY_DN37841_c0_g1~~TRINITY_DN37841_c0_g1_i1.p1  ORF type:complete len:230 (+),score=48.91 TRINITY_DN37841_c0_g1_i1:144-833(+)
MSASSGGGGGGPPKKYKVVFLGDEAAGKTSLVRRYMYGTFEDSIQATIGMDFQSKNVYLESGKSVRLQLWDTAGQERFRSLIPSYIRDAAAAVVVYDVTKRTSFDGTRKWLDDVRSERGEGAVLALVGNKIDLAADREVSTEEGKRQAEDCGVLFLETSAKQGENVSALFQQIAAALPTEGEGAPASKSAAGSSHAADRSESDRNRIQLRAEPASGAEAEHKRKDKCKC